MFLLPITYCLLPDLMITITVNGTLRPLEPHATLLDLIDSLGLKRELVAAEINGELVRRATLADRRLADGDQVEIVEFVGGG